MVKPLLDRVDAPPVAEFSYIAGEMALDFANTLGDRASARPIERLRSYSDLVWWSYGADLIGGRTARQLLVAAREREPEGEAVVARARTLREGLHRVFASRSGGTRPDQADLDLLNDELARARPRLEMLPGEECCTLSFSGGAASLDRILWSVSRSAADLLTSPRLGRVKQCASESCDWLFLDESRNHSRRWCDMRECGNREKARRHYAKMRRPGQGR